MQIQIKTFEDLYSFCSLPGTNIDTIKTLLKETLNVHLIVDDKATALCELRSWWTKYKHLEERPIFITSNQ